VDGWTYGFIRSTLSKSQPKNRQTNTDENPISTAAIVGGNELYVK